MMMMRRRRRKSVIGMARIKLANWASFFCQSTSLGWPASGLDRKVFWIGRNSALCSLHTNRPTLYGLCAAHCAGLLGAHYAQSCAVESLFCSQCKGAPVQHKQSHTLQLGYNL